VKRSISNMSGAAAKWVVPLKRCDHPELRLVCFPYGGGGAAAYWPWQTMLPPNVELWAARLPGRENRIDEAFITDAKTVVARIVDEVRGLNDRKYVLYGHSIGAGLAFETAKRLRDNNEALPILFIASGRLPPHCAPPKKWADRPDSELLGYLSTLGGMPSELDNRIFLSVYLPMIRADFRLNEALPYERAPAFDFPIMIINGEDDPTVNGRQLSEWHEYTSARFESLVIKGDHFFIHNNYQEFMPRLVKVLAACGSPDRSIAVSQKA